MNQKKRVLVVDDEENLRLLYKLELEDEGFDVETVGDAAAALRIMQDDPPDLVVMDIRMPRMDGIEAMGRMLSHRSNLPIILNTGYGSYRDDFRSWPAREYLIKSSDMTDLKASIHRLVDPA
jgi:DNA-binding NtrC family response regulator